MDIKRAADEAKNGVVETHYGNGSGMKAVGLRCSNLSKYHNVCNGMKCSNNNGCQTVLYRVLWFRALFTELLI